MLNLTLITVEKPSPSHTDQALSEYIKRLSAYCKLSLVSIKPARLPDNPSKGEIENALKTEAKAIEKHITPQTVALCVEGKQQTSEQFAETIKSAADTGGKLTFIIGSSYGLAEEIKQKANLRLSMSGMTFPHKLAKVMLLEQIYRGFTILNNKTYHK
jgi:Uncharacterized conserved protein